jgi:uncharacterized membrane protein
MTWYLYALTATIAYTAQMLGMQRLQKSYPISVFMAYVWLGAGTLIGIAFIRPTEHLTLENGLLLCVAAFASWLGMHATNSAIRIQPNIGYVSAVASVRLIFAYAVSLLVFGALFDPVKLIYVAGTAMGAIMVVGLRRQDREGRQTAWVLWALLSAVSFTLLFACAKALAMRGLDIRAATSMLMLLAGLMYVGSSVHNGRNLKPTSDRLALVATIAFSAIGNVAFFSSLAEAPNLAYPAAIDNLRIILLYLTALMVGTDRLELTKGFGVLLTFACAVLLA